MTIRLFWRLYKLKYVGYCGEKLGKSGEKQTEETGLHHLPWKLLSNSSTPNATCYWAIRCLSFGPHVLHRHPEERCARVQHITVSMSQKHGASLGVAGARIRGFSYCWDGASHTATPAWSAAKPPHNKACHGYLFCADTQTLWRLIWRI